MEIGNQYIWYNDYITTPNGKSISYPNLKNIGICYVKDLLDGDKIMTLEKVNDKDMSCIEKFNLKSTI